MASQTSPRGSRRRTSAKPPVSFTNGIRAGITLFRLLPVDLLVLDSQLDLLHAHAVEQYVTLGRLIAGRYLAALPEIGYRMFREVIVELNHFHTATYFKGQPFEK